MIPVERRMKEKRMNEYDFRTKKERKNIELMTENDPCTKKKKRKKDE